MMTMVFVKQVVLILSYVLHSAVAKVHFEGNEPFVWTELGGLRGVHQTVGDKKVAAFLGVPFAQPPIGELRFEEPKPIENWWNGCCPPKDSNLGIICSGDEVNDGNWKTSCKDAVRDAVKPANSCMLTPDGYFPNFRGSEMWNPPKTSEISEDCLYMNIWVPEDPSGEVLVWIFGGGFFSGSPSLDLYNGSVLAAEHKIIVVNINYRLGPFGFLFLGHDSPVKGNMGLLDQQLALQWINKYIKAFDGDAKKVTLFGESAGSASVTAHVLASGSHSYFNKIICLSGSLSNLWATRTPGVLHRVSLEFAKNLSCANFDETPSILECLKEKTSKEIQNAGDAMFNLEFPLTFPFVPINEDKVFFNGNVADIMDGKKFKQVPAMIGTVNDEGTFWLPYYLSGSGFMFDSMLLAEADENQALLTNEQYLQSMNAFKSYFKNANAENWQNILDEYAKMLSGAQTTEEQLRNGVGRFVGDLFFTCHLADFLRDFVAEHEDSVYVYYFNMRSSANPWPEWMGVMHGYEIEYMFGQPIIMPSVYKDELLDSEVQFSKYIMKILADFISSGIPSSDWMPYGASLKKAFVLDKDSMEGQPNYVDLHDDQCELIKSAIPAPGQPTSTSDQLS